MNERPHPDENMLTVSMSECEKIKVDTLSEQQIIAIDECLMRNIKPFWRKLAMIIGLTMSEMKEIYGIDITYIYYYTNLINLTKANNIETQGNIAFIRWSEARLKS